MRIGYLRVSTEDQNIARQADALRPICDELHVETLSAVAKSRPIFEKVVAGLTAGDTLVVWDLDRAFRNTKDALIHADHLKERGVNSRSSALVLIRPRQMGGWRLRLSRLWPSMSATSFLNGPNKGWQSPSETVCVLVHRRR